MLILRRKVGERLVLNGGISLEVLAVEGKRVKLGIQAPSTITVLREELLVAAERPGGEDNAQEPPTPIHPDD